MYNPPSVELLPRYLKEIRRRIDTISRARLRTTPATADISATVMAVPELLQLGKTEEALRAFAYLQGLLHGCGLINKQQWRHVRMAAEGPSQ